MKHYITPEQLAPVEDAPSTIEDFAFKVLKMPFHPEAGAYALVKVPDNWDGKLSARAYFKTNGEVGSVAAVYVSANFYPSGVATPTNSATVVLSASVAGSAGNIASTDVAAIDCTGCSGMMMNVKVQPDLTTTTEDMYVELAMVELFIGEY